MTTRRKPISKWQFRDDRRKEHNTNEFHYFVTSPFYHRSGTNLPEMIDWFHKKQDPFTIWLVPLPNDADYEINFWQPQVEGTQYLGSWELPHA